MDRAKNQLIYEQKDREILYRNSHIRKNLFEWLSLEEEDFFWEIPVDTKKQEVERKLEEMGTQTKRMVLVFLNPFGVEMWNRKKKMGNLFLHEIKEILKELGFSYQKCYYPYPNRDFPMRIYSDDYLPKIGELRIDRMRNFDREIMIYQEEENLYNRLIESGRFTEYANAYLLVAEREEKRELPIFVQYANDRAPEFQMKTEIWKNKDGFQVVKNPMCAEARTHCESIIRCYEELKKETEGTPFSINRCKQIEQGLEFEFIEGKSLEEEIKSYLNDGEGERAKEQIKEYVGHMLDMAKETFQVTESFNEVFGSGRNFSCSKSMKITDIDLIFQNIIRKKEWNVIDYEWTFEFPIPVDFVIYRAFETFMPSGDDRDFNLYELYPISKEDRESYANMEESFQAYVSRDYHTLNEMYLAFGKPCQFVDEKLKEKEQEIEYLKTLIWQMENTKVWKCYKKYRGWREKR